MKHNCLGVDEETKLPHENNEDIMNEDSLRGDISATVPLFDNKHTMIENEYNDKKKAEKDKNDNEEKVSKMRYVKLYYMCSDIGKRAGTFVEFGSDQLSDISKAEALNFNLLKIDDSSDEDDVYPLSIKYERKKVWKTNIYKYIFLVIWIIVIIPYDIYFPSQVKTLQYRIGYFADRIYTESISISGITEVNIQTKNWIVYVLENTASSSLIELYVSASRSTSVAVSLSVTTQTINVQSDVGTVQCYAELKIPGGVTIPKLSFTFDGDSIENLLIYDYKDNSKWVNPMIITALTITISNAYPNIYFQNAHQVSSLTISGLFCNCDFQYLKIASMTFTISVGSLNILQNSVYTQNSKNMRIYN